MSDVTPWRQMSGRERAEAFALGARALIPHLSVIAGFYVMTMPLFAPFPVLPNVGLLLVYLFALYRPRQLSPAGAVPVGLAGDLLSGAPLGANGLILPLFMLAVLWFDSRTERVHWAFDWLAAVPFVLIYQAVLWRLCLFVGADSSFLPFLTQGLATLAAFPPVAYGFVRVQRRFVDRLGASAA